MAAVPSQGRASLARPAIAPADELTSRLYERYRRQVFAFCLRQLGSHEEAEDATQNTFLNAFRGLKRGTTPEYETAWLYKIAHNVCLNGRRTARRRRSFETVGDFDAIQETAAAPQGDTDTLFNLDKALQVMPAQQRRALLLREWQGLAYAEIATEMNLSQSAVETLLFRARRTLAQNLETEPEVRKRGRPRSADAGSGLAILKSLFVGVSTKLAATVLTVAATSVVATTPPVRHQIVHMLDVAAAPMPMQIDHPTPVVKHRHKAIAHIGAASAVSHVTVPSAPQPVRVAHHIQPATKLPAITPVKPAAVAATAPVFHATTRQTPAPHQATPPSSPAVAVTPPQTPVTLVTSSSPAPVDPEASDNSAPVAAVPLTATGGPAVEATAAPASSPAPATPTTTTPAAPATAPAPAPAPITKASQPVATTGTSSPPSTKPTQSATVPTTTKLPILTVPVGTPPATTTPATTTPILTTTTTANTVMPTPIQVPVGAQPTTATTTAASTTPTTTTPAPTTTTPTSSSGNHNYGYFWFGG